MVIQISTFIIGLIMVKLLTPKDFGLMSMVVVITGFANVFKNFGVGAAIIHDQSLDQKDLSTIFWFNVSLGVLISIVIFSLSGVISSFYEEPMLLAITSLLSINFFITSLNLVQFSLLKKKLDFKKIFIAQTIATIFSGSLGIYLAYSGYGVWSLVWKVLTFSSLACLMFWSLHNWRPSFVFQIASLKKIFKFSLPLLGSESFNYWVRNIDNLLIGKFLGGHQLGFYDRSYQLMLMPVTNISSVIVNVLFPSFSKITDDHKRIENIFRLAVGGVCMIVMPLMIGLFLTADTVVNLLFGDEWLEMIPVLKILCLLGISQSVIHLTSSIMLSQGRTKLIFKLGIVTKSFTILMIVIGLQFGIVGVAAFYFMANIITSPIIFYVSGNLIDLEFGLVAKAIIPIIMATFILGISVYALGLYTAQLNLELINTLLLQVIAGAAIYSISIFIFKPEAFIYFRSLYYERFKNTT